MMDLYYTLCALYIEIIQFDFKWFNVLHNDLESDNKITKTICCVWKGKWFCFLYYDFTINIHLPFTFSVVLWYCVLVFTSVYMLDILVGCNCYYIWYKISRAILLAWVVIVTSAIPVALSHGVLNYPYKERNYTACVFLSEEGYSLVGFQVSENVQNLMKTLR